MKSNERGHRLKIVVKSIDSSSISMKKQNEKNSFQIENKKKRISFVQSVETFSRRFGASNENQREKALARRKKLVNVFLNVNFDR